MPKSTRFLDDLHRIAAKALRSGGVFTSPTSIRWVCSGNCQRPHVTEMRAYPSRTNTAKWVVIKRGNAAPMSVDLHTRCRQCPECLRHRANLWTARALAETRAAPRTWFGTLTLSPDAQFMALTRARRRAGQQGVDFDGLSNAERFRMRHDQITPELTKYVKRVRAQCAAPLRILLVAENHKSGAPHYHMLVHETDPDNPIRHKTLSQQWKLGFTQWKLVSDLSQARYVCKYLAKDALARVRASKDYGEPALRLAIGEPIYSDSVYVDPEKGLPLF